ncbi:hypothetical protein KI387_039612, partial [Taxus chinensis]
GTAPSMGDVISALVDKVKELELAQNTQNSYAGQAWAPSYPQNHGKIPTAQNLPVYMNIPNHVDLLTGMGTL